VRTERFLWIWQATIKILSPPQAVEEDFRNYLSKSPKAMGTLGDLLKKIRKETLICPSHNLT